MKTRAPKFTVEYLRSILHYDRETGEWSWLVRKANRIRVGDIAGKTDSHGYRQLTINNFSYLSSRMAVFYETGEWPAGEVDHRDMNPSNDRWSNLRIATRSQNFANQHAYSSNKIWLKGVYRKKGKNYFAAQIQVNKKQIHLGYFPTPEAAHDAYKAAAVQYFGEFSRAF